MLYPGVFPNLAAYHKPRADLNAILLTGIPSGVVPGFQNFTGPVESDMLRLNVAIPPSSSPNNLGLVAGDAAGFPNGRRVDDDVVTIELRAIAGLTIPLVDPSFTPDGAVSAIADGTTNTNGGDDRHVPVPREPGRRLPDRSRGRRRYEHGREPLRRAGRRPARHRGRHRGARRDDAGGHGRHRGGDPSRWERWHTTPTGITEVTSHSHDDGHLAHVAVVERPVAGGTVPSLVFGELTAGRYDLFEKGQPDAVVLTVDVVGGQVTTATWPG